MSEMSRVSRVASTPLMGQDKAADSDLRSIVKTIVDDVRCGSCWEYQEGNYGELCDFIDRRVAAAIQREGV